MEYCFLRGFLVVLLIQHSTSEGLSTAIQSSTAISLQDNQASPQEPELIPAEGPAVAPPSLKEVQQAMQEASEQVEGRGAEEVLKELLERVVEAALGQVEGGGEVKADEAAVEVFEEDPLGDEKGETGTDREAEVLEQAAMEMVEGEDMNAKGGNTGLEEEQEVAEVDAVEEVKGDAQVEVETAAGSMEETTAGVETGDREAEAVEVEVLDESLGAKVSQEVVEETVAALDETGEYLAVEEAGVEDNTEQLELSEEEGAAETEKQEVEETAAVVEEAVGGEPEQATAVESHPSLGVADVEQIWDVWGKEEALGEVTQVDEMEGEVTVPSPDSYEMETTQTVVGEPVEEEVEENIVTDAERPEEEEGQGHLVVEGGGAEEVEAKGIDGGELEGGERHGETVAQEESVALLNEGGDQKAGEEEQMALETSHGSEKEEQEVVISAPEPEDGADTSIEQSPEKQAPTPSPSLGGEENGENTLGEEKYNHGIKIITPTEDLLPHDPAVAQPPLDHFVKDVVAEPPEAEGAEPGEANELVEDTPGKTETSELGLEAWKIAAISAAVFLVLETVVMIFYVVKCRNKNGTQALQRACEEGRVEPEAATGGDCSDDTLPAGNGDPQQIAALDPSDVASTLAQNKEQRLEGHATAMCDLPPSSTEESANAGPGPGSSQDLRTSVL